MSRNPLLWWSELVAEVGDRPWIWVWWVCLLLAGEWGSSPAWAGRRTVKVGPSQATSIGAAGIDALRLHHPPYNLTGRKIAIGQVEIGRPGLFGVDKAAASNQFVLPARVFYRNLRPRVNNDAQGHAQNVASVMISSAKAARGVAPGARLYSSAAAMPKKYGQPEECVSAQFVAMQNGGDLRAINFSFGESLRQDPRPNPVLDGNALLTQCIDWSARVHNVLYLVAGNQGKGGISIPTDNFNGITVAFTTRVEGLFAKVDFSNLGDPTLPTQVNEGVETNLGPRRAIGLVAPGDDVVMVNLDGSTHSSSGTSFAAPHVTATVALLQEFGDRQLRRVCQTNAGCTAPWTLDARRQEVMKAVLLNSTDKIKDQGNGLALGMSRTIVDKTNLSWLDSDAYSSRTIPMHAQMGTGQLNAFRAYQQFSPGQWSPDRPVPPIGWDYRSVGQGVGGAIVIPQVESDRVPELEGFSQPLPIEPEPEYRDYLLEKPLKAGSYVAVTLAWNRWVDLLDRNGNGEFDLNESFRDRGLNDLDLYLMRAEDSDSRQSIWSSESKVDSVEHIFHPVPKAGRYKIRVRFTRQINQVNQPYALAWWTAPER